MSSAPPPLSPRSRLAALLGDNVTAILTEVVTALSPDVLKEIEQDFIDISKARAYNPISRTQNGGAGLHLSLGEGSRSRSASLGSLRLQSSASEDSSLHVLNRMEFIELLEYHLNHKLQHQLQSMMAGLVSPKSAGTARTMNFDEEEGEPARVTAKSASTPYQLFGSAALQHKNRRLFAFSTLFDYCDTTGAGVISYKQLSSFVTDVAAHDMLTKPILSSVAPFRLEKVLTSMPTQKENNFLSSLGLGEPKDEHTDLDSIRSKLGAAASTRKVFCLKNVNLLAATDSRAPDVTLLRLDTLQYVGTLKAMGGLTPSTAVAHVEAAVAFPGHFSDNSIDPSHAYMVTAATDSTMTLWNISPADAAPFGDLLTWPSFYPQQCLVFNDRYNVIYSGCTRGAVRCWDVAKGEQTCHLDGHTESVADIANISTLDAIASCSYDRSVRIWDVITSRQRSVLMGHSAPVVSVAYSPQYRTLLSGSADHTAVVWSPFVDRPLHTLRGHDAALVSVRVSPDTPEAVTADRSGLVICWDMRIWKQLYSWHVGAPESQPQQAKYIPTTKKIAMATSLHKGMLVKREKEMAEATSGLASSSASAATLTRAGESLRAKPAGMSSIPSAVDILPTARAGGSETARAAEAEQRAMDAESDEAGADDLDADRSQQSGVPNKFISVSCVDYCLLPVKHQRNPENDLWAEHEAQNTADSAFAQRYAAIRRASLSRLSLGNLRRSKMEHGRQGSIVMPPNNITTATGLSYSLPPPLFGVPRLAGLNSRSDGRDASDGLELAVSVATDSSTATAVAEPSSLAGASESPEIRHAGPTSGALFVASRALYIYRQSTDPTLDQRAGTQPVMYAAFLPYDNSVLIVLGRDIEIWCSLTGVRKRVYTNVTLANIVAAQVYADAKRVVVADANGALMTFNTATGSPLAIFDTPGSGEIAAVVCDDVESWTIASVRMNGTVFVHVDPEVAAYRSQAQFAPDTLLSWFGGDTKADGTPLGMVNQHVAPPDGTSIVPRIQPRMVCDIHGHYSTHETMDFCPTAAQSGCEILTVAMSKRNRVVCCGGTDEAITLFDIESGKREIKLEAAADITSLLVLPNEPLLISGDSTGTISVWGLRTAGRSFGLLAAFRNQPLAFASLYKSSGVPHGMIAKSAAMSKELNQWAEIATARMSSAKRATSGAGDEAIGLMSMRSDDSEEMDDEAGSPKFLRSPKRFSKNKGIPALQLGKANLRRLQRVSSIPAGAMFPKPSAVTKLDFSIDDMILYVADDIGVVSAWDFSLVAETAAKSASEAAAAGKGTRSMSNPMVPRGSGDVNGTPPKVVDLGFPDGGLSIQTALNMLDNLGAVAGTFPPEAVQLLLQFDLQSLVAVVAAHARRGSNAFNTNLQDPSLAVLPVLRHVTADGGPLASVSTPLPGPELVRLCWSSKLHPDAISSLKVVQPMGLGQSHGRAFPGFVLSCAYDRTVKAVDRSNGTVFGMLSHGTSIAQSATQKFREEFEGMVANKVVQAKRGSYWKLQVESSSFAAAMVAHIENIKERLISMKLRRERARGFVPDTQRPIADEVLHTARRVLAGEKRELIGRSAASLASLDNLPSPSHIIGTIRAAEKAIEDDSQDPKNVLSSEHWIRKDSVVPPASAVRAAKALSVVLGRPIGGPVEEPDLTHKAGTTRSLPALDAKSPPLLAGNKFAAAERFYQMTGGHATGAVSAVTSLKTPALLSASRLMRERLTKSYSTVSIAVQPVVKPTTSTIATVVSAAPALSRGTPLKVPPLSPFGSEPTAPSAADRIAPRFGRNTGHGLSLTRVDTHTLRR